MEGIKDNSIGFMYFINGKQLLKADDVLKEIYVQFKDQDGFLYINYMEETPCDWSII